ncbi:unnamed protein product [Urochloa decumbens]|uniref:DUF1618 domain-containing protein n=1 Tax=Urochloa decumbens TaxID=240449 RepID=A0ABC8XZT1_9POAL
MMSHGAGTHPHPSLCPPPHGDPPIKVPWVLLDLHAYVADRENATSACSEMSNGKAIRATLCTAPPPLVSYICVWCPDLPPTDLAMEPTIEAAEADLVLFRLSLRGYPNRRDYFVYKARGGDGDGGPSLWRLDEADKHILYRRITALLPRRDVGEAGDGGHFHIAALNLSCDPSANFNLCLYDSMDKKWTTSAVCLDMSCSHITSKDVIRFAKFDGEPLLYRDIAFVKGRLTVVELHRSSSDCQGWDISSWSISSPWGEQDDWQKEHTINTSSMIIDDHTANVELLPTKLQDNGATLQPSIVHPTLSLSDSRVVYLMGKVGPREKKALLLSVDMVDTRIQGAAMFDAERMLGCTFIQSRISNFLAMAPGGRGKMKRPGRFHVRYPNKHRQIGLTMMDGVEFGPMQHPGGGGAEEQQDTGAEDGDNKMAVD